MYQQKLKVLRCGVFTMRWDINSYIVFKYIQMLIPWKVNRRYFFPKIILPATPHYTMLHHDTPHFTTHTTPRHTTPFHTTHHITHHITRTPQVHAHHKHTHATCTPHARHTHATPHHTTLDHTTHTPTSPHYNTPHHTTLHAHHTDKIHKKCNNLNAIDVTINMFF